MRTKKFSSKLHRENDGPAKRAVLAYLHREVSQDYKINEDKLGIDILGLTNVEVERRPEWKQFAYPYRTVHIPHRKMKWLKLETLEYYQVNNELSMALYYDKATILKHLGIVENPNKYVPKDEYFIDLPLHISKIIIL